MGKKLTIKRLSNTEFPKLYQKFITHQPCTSSEYECLLSIAVYLLNLEDPLLQRLGYRIIVDYCNQVEDYRPLYEIAINMGLYPISKFIEQKYVSNNQRNFFTFWNDAFSEQFNINGIYRSAQQKGIIDFFEKNSKGNVSVVAPTSYGKSELIIQAIKDFGGKNICIITSTKALLMQTKKRIKAAGDLGYKKIVVHPEMYNGEDKCLAVLTQERLMRLLKNFPTLTFDCIIVDEAHELLENTSRSNMLASDLIVARKRNPKIVIKYLTPFIADSTNLETRYAAYDIHSFKVNEYIKTERYFYCDLKDNTGIFLYDQFLNAFFHTEQTDAIFPEEIVRRYAANKNLVYLNKPTDIEDFALKLAASLPEVHSEQIDRAYKNISEYLMPQYNLLTCLRKGIIYHHGSVPDSIRIYIEDLYRNDPNVKYVITSSTLLSGVNLPAERMFILSNKRGAANLQPDAFRNLIGRVCRFSDIFDSVKGDLQRLEPEIYIVHSTYFDKRANCKKFMQDVARASLNITDKLENVLLANTIITPENQKKYDAAAEFVENYEEGTICDYNKRHTETPIGKACIMNGINEFDIFTCEEFMQRIVDACKNNKIIIDNVADLIEIITHAFIGFLPDDGYDSLKRLEKEEARAFYAMLLTWKINNRSYSEMIALFVNYWRSRLKTDPNTLIFVGHWGDITSENGFRKLYTYLKDKTLQQLINLAIVRIKEEQDFLDNKLIKYVEVLYDISIIDSSFYYQIKYGTTNEEVICLLKNGASLGLANLLIKEYSKYLSINIRQSAVQYKEGLIQKMESNGENAIFIYELKSII